MDFPDTPRVIYRNNPLVEVLFQIRVPRTLAVEARLPVEFQDAVKADFPILRTRQERTVTVVVGSPLAQSNIPVSTLYDFLSADEILKVTLSSEFLALSTSRYEIWDKFRLVGEKLINDFLNIYSPPIVTRIGLRYKDVIQKDKINAKDKVWKDLISENISGVLQNAQNLKEEEDVDIYTSSTRFKIPDGLATLKHGFVRNSQTQEKGYLIDTDYFCEGNLEATPDAILDTLDKFNRYSRRVFRWCISDTLVRAMDPKPFP